MCGAEMVSAEVIPAEAGSVRGFEKIIFQCPGCGASKSRFIFAGEVAGFVGRREETATPTSDLHRICRSNGADESALSQDTSIKLSNAIAEKESSADERRTQSTDGMTEKVTFASEPTLIRQRITPPPISTKSAEAWRRAVEKLRIHQDDLHQRTEKAKNANRTIDCGHELGGHAAARHKNRWTAKPRNDSDAERPGMRPLTLAGHHQSGSVRQAMRIDRQTVVRRFDEFWDSLVPPHNGLQKPLQLSTLAATAAPLPRSLSLVVIEPISTPNAPPQKSVRKNKLEKLFNSLQDAVHLLTT